LFSFVRSSVRACWQNIMSQPFCRSGLQVSIGAHALHLCLRL
jgi:hypothetical protein